MGLSATTDSLDVTNQMLKRRLNILTLLTEEPLWKKRVAQRLDETPQTIGRDIDALHHDGLLEYTLTDGEDTNRTHLIGYTTTDTGTQVLDQHRICTSCGDVVNPAEECVHEYIPISATSRGGEEE